MITDAMNISQSAKVFSTAFALAMFANSMVWRQQDSFHRSQVYKDANIVIPSLHFELWSIVNFELDPIYFNLFDLSMYASQVLAIFALKQLIAIVRKPNSATIIKRVPLLIYKGNEEKKVWSLKKLKIAKIALIAWLCVGFLVGGAQMRLVKEKILGAFALFAMVLTICFLIKGSKMAFYC